VCSLLKRGFEVQSRVKGRIGKVIECLDRGILIRHTTKGEGVTSFDRDGPVKIEREGEIYYVRSEQE